MGAKNQQWQTRGITSLIYLQFGVNLQFVVNLPGHIESMKIKKFWTNENLLTEMLALTEDLLQNSADLQHVVNSMLHVDVIFKNVHGKHEHLQTEFKFYRQFYEQCLSWFDIHASEQLERRTTTVFTDSSGRPSFVISQQQLLSYKELVFWWKKIAQLLGVSRKTLLSKTKEFSMSVPKYSETDDDSLDNIIQEIIQLNPNTGEMMVDGSLLARGVIVQ